MEAASAGRCQVHGRSGALLEKLLPLGSSLGETLMIGINSQHLFTVQNVSSS